MLHACFLPNALCFLHVFLCFLDVFTDKPINKMPQCQFLFYAVFIPEKLFSKYSRNWTKRKLKVLFFPTRQRSPKQRWRRAPRGHTMWWRRLLLGRAAPWCGPLGRPPTSPFRLYISPDAKTLKESASIHEKFRSSVAIEDKFWGTEISISAH